MNRNPSLRVLAPLVLIVPLLHGCAETVIAGGAVGASMAHDRRTSGAYVEDQSIELKGMDAIYSDRDLYNNAHVSVTSYNGIVLLSGEAPTEELRARAENLVRSLPKVRVVHNELTIAAPSSLATRTADSWITTKVKSRMLAEKGFDPSRVKVVTENGTVYLMGIVYRNEADQAVAITRQADGVQRVVKLFEYLD